jgi:hypothetical protein
VIGKKNALGDKPATRRGGAAAATLSWARLPFATQPLLTTDDMAAQRDVVCHISLVSAGICSLLITPVLGNLARGRGHCRARRRFFMKRTVRVHDGLFKFEMSNFRIQTTLYGIPVIRNLVHLCISLSHQLVFQCYLLFSVGPPIFRQC